MVLSEVGGDILEIGFGTGPNLDLIPERVHKITTIDPNSGMNRLARKRIATSGIKVSICGDRRPTQP